MLDWVIAQHVGAPEVGFELLEDGPEVGRLARAAGWSVGNVHAGHLVGEFPHEKIDGEDIESYIAPGNTAVMRGHDKSGRLCHWILEIHLTDPERGFGGFYEQLLDLG